MKTKEQRIKDFEAKWKDGKMCPICGQHKNLKSFQFNPGTRYFSQCVECNKLVSVVSTIKRKVKSSNSKYYDTRIAELKKSIRILELVYELPSASAFDIVKLLCGTITLEDFYNNLE